MKLINPVSRSYAPRSYHDGILVFNYSTGFVKNVGGVNVRKNKTSKFCGGVGVWKIVKLK